MGLSWRLLLAVATTAAAVVLEEPRGAGSVQTEDADYDIVHPVKVDERGSFVSYNLSHRWVSKRALSGQNRPLAFYELHHRGQRLRFNLSLNSHLLAPGFVSERRYGGIARAEIQAYSQNSCHMIGSVQNQEQESGLAALSTCDGLKGVFQLANEDFFIEPLVASKSRRGAAHPHKIYRRHIPEYEAEEFIAVANTKQVREPPANVRMCGVQESLEKSEKRRERWEEKQQRKHRIKGRSVSKEKWVETLVVADTKMVAYHGSENIEKYVLTVMNMVAGLFHDASIGNPIHISIVRLILLEDEEEDLKITHHADNTLRSFCKWQKAINVKGDAHSLHHDVAVLLTRKDICAAMNRPCETLGLSHVSGMCQPHRSCNINEDTGLPLAFTVAHELGHSFGIQHDGSGNDCEPVGKSPFIMSPQLLYDTSPLTWSRCSREYITRFLDRGWGLCLDDPPAKEAIDYPSMPPGVLYDVGHQCRLQYGAHSTYCEDMDSVCSTLWCSVGSTCHSKLDAAVDGTKCEEDKWCFNGECVRVGTRPQAIHGGWAAWGSWAACSRTCGGGVQNAERPCNSPTPKYGGKYCLGERRRYRVCNRKACPAGRPSFRQLQCSRFDAKPYKGKLYKWTPIPNSISPCELHCRPEDEYFAEKLRDAVLDGTPCGEGNSSGDRCINGICKNIGCDYEIDSYAVEDRCGVCRGDGSTCQTVKKTFEESEGLGYVDVGLIPAGAREIQIEEVAEAENFLALRSEDPEKYFLNGGWTIQWNGVYQVAGTTFTYERTGNWENLTSPGPTEEPVWIQLLFQEKNPGIRYQYTIRRESDSENEITPAEFFWQYGSWTKCTATCGTGVQRQIVHCLEKTAGAVEERYCDALSRPDDKQRSCSEDPCPARWWAGEWQACSATCGDGGLMKRTILCLQSVALDEQRALPPGECQHLSKPDATAPCNRELLCPAEWVAGNWSECSVTCGSGTRWRSVDCPGENGASCDLVQRPPAETACLLPPCRDRINSPVPDWSGSGSSSKELFNEIHFIPSHHLPKFIPLAPKSNAITEEDFSAGSNKKGNVFVDDFYYDYNFINFHEDLSYDLANEKENKGEGLEPEDGAKSGNKEKADSKEMLPNFLPTAKPESGMKKGSPASPAVGQNSGEEHDTVQGSTVNFQDTVGTTLAISTASSIVAKGEGTGSSLLEDLLSTLETMRHFPSSNAGHASVGNTLEEPLRSTILKEDGTVTAASSSFRSWATLAPTLPFGKRHNAQGSQSGPPDTTQDPDGRVQDPRSSGISIPGFSAVSEGGLRGVSSTSQAVVSGKEAMSTPPPVKEVQVSTVPTAAARTRVTPFDLPHQTFRSTEATPNLQDARERSKSPDRTGSSQNVGKDKSHLDSAQKQHPSPTGILQARDVLPPVTDLPSGQPTPVHESPGHGSQVLASRSPGPPELQSSAEPASWEQGTTLPNSWPSALPTPQWKELDAKQSSHEDQELFGHGNQLPDTSLPSGAHRVLATTSRGGLGPSLTTTKRQDMVEGKEASSVAAPSAAAVPAVLNATWEAGNWSKCSTSCGLGAIWRTVRCSTGKDDDCPPPRKPIPARRCYLRPCSTWRVGNWSKCTGACGGGMKFRDLQCIDARDQRPLRPFHCQSVLFKPSAQMPCPAQPCLDWYTSSWRECSELCGGGEQERLVTCPEAGRCEERLRPAHRRPCNAQPCTKWALGSWGQCTATCGGGVQRRQVKCVNTKTGEAEEEQSLCGPEERPEDTQKCSPQDCSPSESGSVCERDRLSFGFCQTLLFLGRCHLPTVSAQCCRTCHHHHHHSPGGTRGRGDERASRR
ncbi:A disintegrin and metalloproteinase with thrombospondin motifs 7 isoform X2 [Hemicordylus capensis]|uniref:A disintegrin and metalloproteinase with thrombospondin motifs 7 isoform X2 n=1 Tax=Hemicordylus capensis TaxID=884348 RepID=UPI002304C51B|nr:A disintegrin and metalloproteinase with thrombospondin motifs 7 isoform X2 [Hemicordylus capensis]